MTEDREPLAGDVMVTSTTSPRRSEMQAARQVLAMTEDRVPTTEPFVVYDRETRNAIGDHESLFVDYYERPEQPVPPLDRESFKKRLDHDPVARYFFEMGMAAERQPAPPFDGDLYDHLAAMHVIVHGTACPLCNARREARDD